MTTQTCKNCKHWTLQARESWEEPRDFDEGKCASPKFVYEDKIERDGLRYWDYESYSAGFETGEDFGCIHFEAKP